jgi:hypothetical protein
MDERLLWLYAGHLVLVAVTAARVARRWRDYSAPLITSLPLARP